VQGLRQREQLDSRVAALGRQLHTHTQALTTLQDLSIGLARTGGLAELVPEALRLLEQNMAYASASVWGHANLDRDEPVVLLGCRSKADELAGTRAAELTGQPLPHAHLQHYEQIERSGMAIIENSPPQSLLSWLHGLVNDHALADARCWGTRAWIAVPLKVNERVLGVLQVDHGEADYFDAERIRLLDAVASQTALALSHAQALSRERDSAVSTERNRIARDLHDAVSQTLFAANLLAGTMAHDEGLNLAVRAQAQTLERLNRSALAEMRMMLFELRPDALAGVGLSELLQHATQALSGRSTVQVKTDVVNDPALPSPLRVEVYRIAQEALSNIARHSDAQHAQVSWQVRGPTHGVLRIADDGRGFDPGVTHPGHFGLENMRQRAEKLGAALHIRSAPGHGSELVLDLHWST
jgi:signal transduction histidine kinase